VSNEQPQSSNRSMPWNLGRFHKIDDTHIKILRFFSQTFTGEWNYFKTKTILISLGLKERDFYNRLATLEKHGFIQIDKVSTPRAYKILPLTRELLDRATAVVVSTRGQSHPKIASLPTRVKEQFKEEPEIKPDMDRPHDVWLNVKIPQASLPADWDSRRLAVLKVSYPDYKPMNLAHGVSIYRFPVAPAEFRAVWVRSNPTGFTLEIFPRKSAELFNNPRQVFKEVFTAVNKVNGELERIFKVPLIVENKLNIEVSKQSHALILNEFAKLLLELKDAIKAESGQDFDINFYDEKGNIIAKPDRSLGVFLPEMDFPEAKSSEQIAQGMKDFIDQQILKGGWKAEQEILKQTIEATKQVADNQKELSKNQQSIAENQTKFGEQMVDYGQKIHAHTESIQKLGSGVDTLKAGIDDMTKKFGEGIDQLSGSVKQLSDSVSEIKSRGIINRLKRLFKLQ